MQKIFGIKIKNVFDVFSKNGRTIAIYMFFLLIVKQFIVFGNYREAFFGKSFLEIFYNYLGFLSGDLLVYSIVLGFVILNFSIKYKILKVFFNIFNLIIIIFFSIDIFINYYFHSRLSISDIINFVNNSNSNYLDRYILPIIGIFLSLFLIVFYLVQNYTKKLSRSKVFVFVFIFSFSLGLLSLLNYYRFGNTFDENILTLNANKIVKKESESKNFENKEKKYEQYFRYIKGKNKKLNVILIFAESLSALDSYRISGLENNLQFLDEIQKNGKTFKNFISNGYTSDTAHVATLKGIEPRNNPISETNKFYEIYKSYTISLPEFLNNLGYKTIFMSSVTLNFFDQLDFLSGIKFQEVIGEEFFENEKKYVFDAAPDKVLFDKALEKIIKLQTQSGNYFLNLQTISFHKPYNTPYGNSENDALKYSDESLYYFYQNLKNLNFFDNGILLIVSDHRKMENIYEKEFEKYGISANGRAVLTVLGSGIYQDVFDEKIIQHTDIFHSIKYFLGSGNILVSSLFNNIFGENEGRERGIVFCHYCPIKKIVVVKKKLQSYQSKNIQEIKSKGDEKIFDYINSFYSFQLQ